MVHRSRDWVQRSQCRPFARWRRRNALVTLASFIAWGQSCGTYSTPACEWQSTASPTVLEEEEEEDADSLWPSVAAPARVRLTSTLPSVQCLSGLVYAISTLKFHKAYSSSSPCAWQPL